METVAREKSVAPRLLGLWLAGLWLTGLCIAGLLAVAPRAALAAANDTAAPLDVAAPGAPPNFNLFDKPRPVPQIAFTDGDGADRSLDDFRGRVVLLNLWATWCAPCRREMPTLDRLQARLGSKGLEVVALSIDRVGRERVREFLAEVGAPHLKLYLDRTTRSMRTLGIIGLPTTLLIDRRGREVGRLIGPAEWDSSEAVELIEHFLGDEPDAPEEARLTGSPRR